MRTPAERVDAGAALRSGSLRARTVVSVLALLTVLLVALCFTVQLVLGDRLRGQLEDRLRDRAAAAAALIGTVSNDDLADRLSAQGISVLIESADGDSVVAGPTPDQLRKGPAADGLAPLGGPAGAPGDAVSTTDPAASGEEATAAASGVDVTGFTVVTSDAQILTLEFDLSDSSTVTLTADASGVEETLLQLRWIMAGASVVFLALASALLALVVRGALHPLEEMTELARDIAHGDRGRRLRPRRPNTEIGRVATAFDEMLEGVEGAETAARAAEDRVRSFVSDAAHELRTPVSGMQAAADTLVRSSVDRAERERLAFHVVREAGRASRLIDDMLMMARVDQGLVLQRRRIDLAEVVEREVERQRIRKPALVLDCGADPLHLDDHLLVDADPERVTQVIANLIDNASRMTGGTGPVTVTWAAAGGCARVTVSDHGPGVPEADRARIFDRLVRLETARNAVGGGAGLGLPIARGIARASGGDLACVEPSPGAQPGAAFLLTLPLAEESERD